MRLLLDLLQANLGNGVVAVKDSRNFFKSWALCFDVEVVDKDEFAKVPQSVEKHEIPMTWEVVPCKLVRLATRPGQSNYGN